MRSIDGYDLVRELARGGMGVVYEARDRATGRPVALKVLLAVSDPDARARFRVEGEAAARLRHPGIVAVHAMGESGGSPYLVMDLVKGDTLESRLKRGGPFAPREAARIAELAASALEHAHAQGIVHRDLKPSNVLIDDAGRPLLTDFGVAKLSDGAPLTRTGDLLGTPSFMAPEQLDGRRADARTDVYGLGATLFALLTGQPPFTGPVMQVLAALVNKPAPRPSSLRPDVPRALDDLVLACLQKDPAKRPASMTELAQALADVLDAAPARSSRARPLLVVVALALVAAGVALVASRRQVEPPVEHAAALVETRPPARPASAVAPVATRRAAPEVAPKPKLAPLPLQRVVPVQMALLSGGPVDEEEVERLLVYAAENDPRMLTDALEARARRRYHAGQLLESLEDLDRLRSVSAERAAEALHVRLWVLAALAALAPEPALRRIDEDLARPDVDADALFGLSVERLRLLVKLGRAVEGRAALRSVLSRMPEGDDRLLLHWSASCDQGVPAELEQLVEVLGSALDRDPTAVELMRHRAVALARLQRLPEAIAQLRPALALAPTDGPLHLIYAQWVLGSGDQAAGFAALEAAAAAEPESSQLRDTVANLYESGKRLDDALRHRLEALRLQPDDAALRDALARTRRLIAERDGAPPR